MPFNPLQRAAALVTRSHKSIAGQTDVVVKPDTVMRLPSAAGSASDERQEGQSRGLFLLSPLAVTAKGPESQSTSNQIDIVAIHGINGDVLKTWTHPNGHCWLRDSLPNSLPGARVFSYGYDSGVAFSHSFACIDDYARRLLVDLSDVREQKSSITETGSSQREKSPKTIFVCHSMGGLVVKRALLMAHEEKALYGNILDSTIGICFLGTPHRGSEATRLTAVLADIINLTFVAGRFRSDLLKGLERGERTLKNLSAGFRTLTGQLQIASFYELKTTYPFRQRIVDEWSALLDLPNEEQIPMNTDHRDICRFESASSKEYLAVLHRLLKIADLPGSKIKHNIFKTPYPSSKNFTGRADYLARIEEILIRNEPRRVALYGLRGSGKTQTAIRFAELHRSDYSSVFFINASSDEDIVSEFDKLHDLLQLATTKEAERAAQVKKWFSDDANSPWLLVLDNADALETTNVSKFLPQGNGHIIITTQDHRVQYSDLVDDALQLDMMSVDESRYLLRSRAGFQSLSEQETSFADEIAKQLGFLPLALDSAAAQVHYQRLSFEIYLSIFQERQENSRQLLRYRPRMSNYDKAIFDVLDINFDLIRAESSCAFSLLMLFAHLDGASIPFDLLYRGVVPQWRPGPNGELFLQSPQQGCVDSSILELINDKIAFHTAIERLMSLSLIYHNEAAAGDPSQEVAMHPLVQLHVQSRLTSSQKESGIFCALSLVAQAFPSTFRLEEFARAKAFTLSSLDEYKTLEYKYLPHARACCRNLESLLEPRQMPGVANTLNLKLRACTNGGPTLLQHAAYLFSEASIVKMSRVTHYGLDSSTSDWCLRFFNFNDALLEDEDDEYSRIVHLQDRIMFMSSQGKHAEVSSISLKFMSENYPSFLQQSKSVKPISTVPLVNAGLCKILVTLAGRNVRESAASAPYEESQRFLSLCRAVDPTAPSTAERIVLDLATRIKGMVYKDGGKWENGAQTLEAYCNSCLVPGSMEEGWATADWAQCLIELERSTEAECVIRKLLATRATDPKFQSDRPLADGENDHNLLHIFLAECHLRQGRLAEAEGRFDVVLAFVLDSEILPYDYTTRIFIIYCGLARIAHLRADWPLAKARWEQAVAYGVPVSPGSVPWGRGHFYVGVAIYSQADALFELGQVQAALALKEEVESSGMLEKQNRMLWMMSLGSYWLEEMEEKWKQRIATIE